MVREDAQTVGDEWVSFPGGELEGKRPKALCPACREALARQASGRVRPSRASDRARLLCFQCYRAGLDRDRTIRDAGQLDTASDARFQFQLPFEPIDKPRLEMLKVERADARAAAASGTGEFVDKRRHAQIEARHALQAIADGLKSRLQAPLNAAPEKDARDRAIALAIHAAELQLPEAWLPFVVAR
jgi:hypothetical protein